MTQLETVTLPVEPQRNPLTRQRLTDLAPAFVFVAIIAVVLVAQPSFLGVGVGVLTLQAAPILLLALGHMVVLRTGGIDLSNAAVAVACAIVLASLLGSLGPLAIVVTLAVGAGAGVLNGVLTTKFQVPSFSVTLGTLGVWQAAALLLSGATTVYVSQNIGLIRWMVQTQVAGITVSFLVAAVAAVVLWLVFRYSRYGVGLTALGLNEKASILSGVHTQRVRILAFGISGLLAAGAGVLIVAQQSAATASGYGVALLMPSIAAAIIGGCAISGGVGHPLNVLFGALIVALIPMATVLLGIGANVQLLIYGAVIVIASALTMKRRT